MTPRLAHNQRETAAILGVSRNIVIRLVAEGRLRPVVVGRRHLYPLSEIERFLREEST